MSFAKISILYKNLFLITDFVVNAIYVSVLKKKGKVYLGERIQLQKFPIIEMDKQSELHLADRVILRSDNHEYHVNMFGRTKIYIENEGQVHIGERTRIHGTCIHARQEIRIGRRCLIAANCQIMDSNGHDLSFMDVENRINTRSACKPVVIEDDVWLGTGVVVLPGVRIGKGSVISANSVVHKSIPPFTLAGGNPIRIIKTFPAAEKSGDPS
jgi:acetyltransferase-like isoleucine patch superfamily enzyme